MIVRDAEWWRQYRAQRKEAGTPVDARRRQGDRHLDHERVHGKRGKMLTKFARAKFVAWDGEGITVRDDRCLYHKALVGSPCTCKHLYTLLANSEGASLHNDAGIPTRDALRLLVEEGRKHRNAIHVIFGGSYDVNMILGDLSKDQLTELWRTGTVHLDEYVVKYSPRKRFQVLRHPESHWFQDGKPLYDASIMVWDVFGFIQGSFVAGIREWLGEVDELQTIERMKEGRADFKAEDAAEVARYNSLELAYLTDIAGRVADAHRRAGLELQAWDGAGASAATAMRLHGAKRYIAPLPDAVQWAAQYAYSGGRIEAVKIGNKVGGKVHRYDINSAYPSVMGELPCLVHGKWWHNDFGLLSDSDSDFAVDRVSWWLDDAPFHPLYYRSRNGTILYPSQGQGWYWRPEVQAAEQFFGPHVKVEESWAYSTDCDCRPLAWVSELYEYRQRLKAEGNAAEKAIKLALNAMYGKFSQQVGWSKSNRIPTYHSLAWAGYITSAIRAKLYNAAMQHPESVISFATDAILSLTEHDLPVGEGLGEWTHDVYTGLTVVQAGVYWTRDGEGHWSEKYRGFDRTRRDPLTGRVVSGLDREAILEAWHSRGNYSASLTRFIGMGSALSSEPCWPLWRSWQTTSRSLLIYPTGKRSEKSKYDYSTGLKPTLPAFNFSPDLLSLAYPIAWQAKREDDLVWDDLFDGIPVKIVHDEVEDSWL